MSVVLCALTSYCGKDGGTTGPTPANIVLNVESITLAQLDSIQIVPSVVDGKGTLISSVPISFSSSDAAIVSVSAVGVVKSIGPAGAATITVKAANLTKTLPVTVQSVPVRLLVTPNPAVLPQKGTLQLEVKLLDRIDVPIPNAAFSFASSTVALATVSPSGLVTSVGPAGSLTITVRAAELAITVALAITQVATKLVVNPPLPRIGTGRSLRLTATVLDAVDAVIEGISFTYLSLTPSLVTIAGDGTVTSVGPLGTATVRVSAVGVPLSATVQVEVTPYTSPIGSSLQHIPAAPSYAVAFASPDQAAAVHFITQAGQLINLTDRSVAALPGADAAYGIAVDPSRRRAYLTTAAGSLREIDLSTGAVSEVPLITPVLGIALSPDGRFAYLGTDTQQLIVVNLMTRAVASRIPVTSLGLHVSLDQKGQRAYVSGNGGLVEVDLTGGGQLRSFNIPDAQATAVHSDGRTLYVGTEAAAVWSVDLVTGNAAPFVPTPFCGSWGLLLTRDERFLYLACSLHGAVMIVDVHTRQIVRTLAPVQEPRRIATSTDGSIVIVAAGNGIGVIR